MSPSRLSFDFSKTEGQSLIIQSVRLIFLALVFFITLTFQHLESRIVSSESFSPIYTLIAFSFFVQVVYFAFFKSLYKKRFITYSLFLLESFYITGLIYFIGIQQSVLIFLYLVNIILCGVLFQRKGALLLALCTSILFSLIVSLDPSIGGNTAYLAIGVNNLTFFAIAYLSGFLSEQLNVMGEQLKERTRDVKALKNLNELILNNMSSGLLTVSRDGEILQHNPAALTILGLNTMSLNGQNISKVLPKIEHHIGQKEESSFDINIKKSGERRLLRIHISGLADEVGSLRGQVIGFQDETLLRNLEKRVRQSEKMAAIGQLATGIAHEIRNPLAGISGSIQLMQGSSPSDTEENHKLMNIVNREIDRLNNLITEFLDFAKPEAPMEDKVLIGSLLEEIVDFTSFDQKNMNVDKLFDCEEEVEILGNRDKLKQAFLNIIVNSFQAMGKVEKPQIHLKVSRGGDQAVVVLRDNGCGMDEKSIERIFEPFHTTKHKGTGLGLAITHSIFESHGAEVQVESAIGKGTQFTIQFPLSTSP